MNMRNHAYHPPVMRGRAVGRREPQFAPEAYGDFEVVAAERIAEEQRKLDLQYGFGSGRWRAVEDVER